MNILRRANEAWLNTTSGMNKPTVTMNQKAHDMICDTHPELHNLLKYKGSEVEIDNSCPGIIFDNKINGLTETVKV